MFSNDPRTVLTLDAGGTNFVFTAIRGNKETTDPVVLPSHSDNRKVCLATIVEGFSTIKKMLEIILIMKFRFMIMVEAIVKR